MDEQQQHRRQKIIRAIVPVIVSAVTEAAACDDQMGNDDEEVLFTAPLPRDLPKSRGYFCLIEEMDEEEFHSHFRLGRCKYCY